MDHIRDILSTFDTRSKTEFRKFLTRQKHSESRKDVRLFEMLASQKEEGAFTRNLTPKARDNYYALRKRLARQLAAFIVLRQTQDDLSENGMLSGQISLSRYLFEQGLPHVAWKYLKKAEQLGLESEQYALLHSTYLLMIEYAHTGSLYSLSEILQRQEEARKLARAQEQLIVVTALIRQKLEEAKATARLDDFPAFVEDTLQQYEVSAVLNDRPQQLFQLMEIVRNTYLALRNLREFEPFVRRYFRQFERAASGRKQFHYYRLRFLYMIAHVLYRNRKFKQSTLYLERFYEAIQAYEKRYYIQFYPRYVALFSSVKSLSGDNEAAIRLHEEVLFGKKHRLSVTDELNMKLNLAFFYFNAREFKKANRLFVQQQHSDGWYAKKMGQEWVLRRRLIQLVIHYELGHEEISLSLLRSIERDFSQMLHTPQYRQAANFLSILRQYLADPYSLSFRTFRKVAEKELFAARPGEEESKAIAFYCWMKSKLTGADYYHILLEEMKALRD